MDRPALREGSNMSEPMGNSGNSQLFTPAVRGDSPDAIPRDRKSTRLNSSHGYISYAVFCLKKKKNRHRLRTTQRMAPVEHRPFLPLNSIPYRTLSPRPRHVLSAHAQPQYIPRRNTL